MYRIYVPIAYVLYRIFCVRYTMCTVNVGGTMFVHMTPPHIRVCTCTTCTDIPCIHILLSFMMYMSASVLVLSHRVYNRAHIRVRMYATVCVHPASHLNINACARVLARINVCVPTTLSVPMQCIVSVSVAVSVCMLISNMLYCVICRCFSCVHRVFSPRIHITSSYLHI